MRLGHFDLNLFVALDALLETRSITRAANRLNLGVSATSSALGRLREHFGDELLVQVGRRMELTPLAARLREPVREILVRSQGTLAAQEDFDPASAQKRFVFNASDYATTVLLMPLAQRLEHDAPGLRLEIVGLGDSSVQRLQQGDVDFAIYPERDASAEHPMAPLLTETFSLVVWTGFRLDGDQLSAQAYCAGRHVAAEFGDRRIASYETVALANQGIRRDVVVTTSTFNGLAPLVVGTQRIATIHTRLACMWARMLPLRVLPLPEGIAVPPLTLVMQWNRHQSLDAAHAWLRERIQETAAVA